MSCSYLFDFLQIIQFLNRNTQVHPVQERRDNIQVTQADNTQSNKQRENAKSSAFKFETGTISRAKNKSQKNLTIDETWINEKVRECANLQGMPDFFLPFFLPLQNKCFWEYTRISLSVCVSNCVQNTSFCQTAAGGI